MRTITKNMSLKVGDADLDFRLTKLDAFSGAHLLKIISRASSDNLQDLILSLPEQELDALMQTCLRSVSVLLPAGPIPVLSDSGWGVPDLEYDAWSCLKLTMEVVSWTLEGFFPDSGSPS